LLANTKNPAFPNSGNYIGGNTPSKIQYAQWQQKTLLDNTKNLVSHIARITKSGIPKFWQ